MKRRGFTLTELLIVILIMVIVAVVSLPLAKTLLEGNRTREASRQLQSYFAMAQARAAQTGRPCGVHFVCVESLGQPGIYQTTQCYLAEVPASYTGSTLNSRGIFRMEPHASGPRAEFVPLVPGPAGHIPPDGQWVRTGTMQPPYPPFSIYTEVVPNTHNGATIIPDTNNDGRWDEDTAERAMLSSLLGANDVFAVRIAGDGPWFACAHDNGRFRLLDTAVSPVPTGFNLQASGGFAFEIRRPPQRMGSPMEMTDGSCVDLAYSGTGRNNREFSAATQTLTVMFSAGGQLNSIWVNGQVPTGILPAAAHFLVGRVEKLTLPSGGDWDKPNLSNIADTTAIWVTVGRNGHVTTTENLATAAAAQLGLGNLVEAGRTAAIERSQMSGR